MQNGNKTLTCIPVFSLFTDHTATIETIYEKIVRVWLQQMLCRRRTAFGWQIRPRIRWRGRRRRAIFEGRWKQRYAVFAYRWPRTVTLIYMTLSSGTGFRIHNVRVINAKLGQVWSSPGISRFCWMCCGVAWWPTLTVLHQTGRCSVAQWRTQKPVRSLAETHHLPPTNAVEPVQATGLEWRSDTWTC